jgi:hypothetical protein
MAAYATASRFLTDKKTAFSIFRNGWGAIQIVAHVIANPQGEAIHASTLDCFTLRVRNDGEAGKLYKSPCFLFALLKAT